MRTASANPRSPDAVTSIQGRSSSETRSAVLDLIRSSDKISRPDLVRRSGLTEVTVSKIVKELLAAGLIVHAGYDKSTGGKRPALLQLSGGGRYAVGVSLTTDEYNIVLCGPNGTKLTNSIIRNTKAEEPETVLDSVAHDVTRLLVEEEVDRNAVMGLGVATGPRWGFSGSHPQLWGDIAIKAELAQRTGFATIENSEARCVAMGEFWASREPCRDFIVVYLSSGIEAGIIMNGAIYQGVSGNAGAIGHMIAVPGGKPCWCGLRGCLEMEASYRSIVDGVIADPNLRKIVGIDVLTPFGEVLRKLFEISASDHVLIGEVLKSAADHVASAIGKLVKMLDVDLVVLAGPGIAGADGLLLRAAQERVSPAGVMRDSRPIAVRAASAGSEAAAIGAATLVLQRNLTPYGSASVH